MLVRHWQVQWHPIPPLGRLLGLLLERLLPNSLLLILDRLSFLVPSRSKGFPFSSPNVVKLQWKCEMCGFGPRYFRHFQFSVGLQMRLLWMMYAMRLSPRLAHLRIFSTRSKTSSLCAAKSVSISIARTIPDLGSGLWSDLRVECLMSAIHPSDFLSLSG